MATRIFIPTPLRSYTGNQAQIQVEAGTVEEALQTLVRVNPGLREHLYDNEGKLRSFINIYLNDNDIRYLADTETAIGTDDTISIIPAIAGGAPL